MCKERGWGRPTIYQALYNAIPRGIEDELIPCCRRYGIDVVNFNPLAGGFFSGKYNLTNNKTNPPRAASATKPTPFKLKCTATGTSNPACSILSNFGEQAWSESG